MQLLGFGTRGQAFPQGQVGTAPRITKAEVTLKRSQPNHFFNLNAWLPAQLKTKAHSYEASYSLTLENPHLYVSRCITSREVPGVAKELCRIFVFPTFALTSEENHVCNFSINFEVTESSITRFQFILIDPLAEENWQSEELSIGLENLL